jgi:phage shock protein A
MERTPDCEVEGSAYATFVGVLILTISDGDKERRTTMALLERVRTLVRANINDLIDKAEDPEKMIKQLILDMENQLIQVKTQVAVAMADEHLLEKKKQENEAKTAEWMRKAELAIDKKQDDLARVALERYRGCQQLCVAFEEQIADQKVQVENLKFALQKLEQKLGEVRTKGDLLMARHRRARATNKTGDTQMAIARTSHSSSFDRISRSVLHAEALGHAKVEIANESVEDQLAQLEADDEVERLLAEVKSRRALNP